MSFRTYLYVLSIHTASHDGDGNEKNYNSARPSHFLVQDFRDASLRQRETSSCDVLCISLSKVGYKVFKSSSQEKSTHISQGALLNEFPVFNFLIVQSL